MTDRPRPPTGPHVVALGGGHGLAAALRARSARYAGSITAVVSVADDGGSSGRLRRDLGVARARRPAPVPGRARRRRRVVAGGVRAPVRAAASSTATRSATSCSSGWPRRSATSPPRSTRPAGCSARSAGCCRRRTEPVVLKADVGGAEPARSRARSRWRTAPGIRRVELVPGRRRRAARTRSPRSRAADQVVLAPGSLYTSLLPVLCVPRAPGGARRDAGPGSCRSANLRPQLPETAGLDAHRPPARRCSTTAAGSTASCYDAGRRSSRSTRRGSGRWGVEPVAARDRPAPTGSPTIPAQIGDGARRLCCSPPDELNGRHQEGTQ